MNQKQRNDRYWKAMGHPDHGIDPITSILMGLHSNVPPCCVLWYATSTFDEQNKRSKEAQHLGATYIIPCDDCLEKRNFKEMHMCYEGCGNGIKDFYPTYFTIPGQVGDVKQTLRKYKLEVEDCFQNCEKKPSVTIFLNNYSDMKQLIKIFPNGKVCQDEYEKIPSVFDIFKVYPKLK